jgi:two-component system chemotaxis sensor kinase CheA
MNEFEEVIQEFLVEANEELDHLDTDLVELEKDPTNKVLLARIFRAVHTIKGSAGTLGFPKLAALTHVGENLLSRMRDGGLLLNPEITSVLLSMMDAVREILSTIGASSSEGTGDYSAVATALSQLIEAHKIATTPSAPEPKPTPPPAQPQPPLLGEILVEARVAEPEHIAAALETQQSGDPRKLGEILMAEGVVTPGAVVDALKSQADAAEHSSNTIRVDVGLLDRLMNLVGELVLARNQVLQFTATTTENAAILGTAQRLNLITTELQEGVMKTRMQPIGTVWNKLPRLVRDLAVSCGKAIEIEMTGADTELDKTILEAIKGPMTHLIRNAVDHGIEAPEVRVARGKPREGRLKLSAFHEGGQVNIEISDDGNGINLEAVTRRSVEKGLVRADQAVLLTERDILNLTFAPGVSTAKEVTNISGRGVGMDVVKTNIEKIGGIIDLQSTAGHGTAIKIKIPLTLAIIPALIVTSGGDRFAIPQVSLVELVGLEGEQLRQKIEMVHGAPVYRRRGRLLPLVYLNRELKLCPATTQAGDSANIVVLQAGERQFGLVVDEINDTEEIVVKPLSKQLKSLSCFAGATIMGDGRVALILDVPGLAQFASVVTELRKAAPNEENLAKSSGTDGRTHTWLVFRVGGEGRLAIPLALVSRLEEFPLSQIEHSSGQEVIQYRGQIMRLVRVSTVLGRPTPTSTDPLQVIVYIENGRSTGLVVDEIVDITEQDVVVEHERSTSLLMGTAVIQQRVTDLFNVHALHCGAIPEPEVAQV